MFVCLVIFFLPFLNNKKGKVMGLVGGFLLGQSKTKHHFVRCAWWNYNSNGCHTVGFGVRLGFAVQGFTGISQGLVLLVELGSAWIFP